MKKLFLFFIVFVCMLAGCSNGNEFDMNQLEYYCQKKGYSISEKIDNSSTQEEDGNLYKKYIVNLTSFIVEICITNRHYTASVTCPSYMSGEEISEFVELLNFFSKQPFNFELMDDFIKNEKYSVHLDADNVEKTIHIRNFDFWHNYTGEYRVYDDESISLEITGDIKY